MMDACHVDYPQEYYLLDWDWDYTTLTTLRGWSLTSALQRVLCEQYAEDWFRNPDAGEQLRSILGNRLQECVDLKPRDEHRLEPIGHGQVHY